MESTVKLSSFPRNDLEACAFLYMQNRDLSSKNPSEIYEMYLEAYYEIEKEYSRKNKSGWFMTKEEEVRQVK